MRNGPLLTSSLFERGNDLILSRGERSDVEELVTRRSLGVSESGDDGFSYGGEVGDGGFLVTCEMILVFCR